MNHKLEGRLASLEHLRQQMIKSVQVVSADQHHLQPAPGKWSMMQVLDHVVQAEAGSLRYILKKSQAQNPAQAGPASAIKSFSLHLLLRSPIRFKRPSKVEEPSNSKSFAELLAEWQEARDTLSDFLANLPAERMNAIVYRHPMAGYLNIFQALQFMEDHLAHHIRQIGRIQSQLMAGQTVDSA